MPSMVGSREPPDGGVRAWVVVLGCFLLDMCSFGYLNACGIFQSYYQNVMFPDKSASQIAWITTLQIFLIFAFGPLVGDLTDRFSVRVVVAPFAVLAIVALVLLSFCKEYWQVVLVQGVAFGLACGGTTLPAIVIASKWFSSKRGLAVGIASCGSNVGGIFWPIMVSKLIAKKGFAQAIRWSLLANAVFFVIAVLCVDSPFPTSEEHSKEIEDRALPLEIPLSTKSRSTDVSNDASPEHSLHEMAAKEEVRLDHQPPIPSNSVQIPPKKKSIFSALEHNRLGWFCFTLGTFFFTWSLLAPFNYLPVMCMANGMSADLAQYTLSIANAAAMFGRVIPAHISDKLGSFNVMVAVTVTSALSMLAFWLPIQYYPSNAAFIIFAIVYGFVSSGFFSLASLCVVALCQGNIEDLGMKFGLGCVALALGSLIGLPTVAAAKSNSPPHEYVGLVIFSAAVMSIGAVLMVVTRVKMAGWKLNVKV